MAKPFCNPKSISCDLSHFSYKNELKQSSGRYCEKVGFLQKGTTKFSVSWFWDCSEMRLSVILGWLLWLPRHETESRGGGARERRDGGGEGS